MDAPLALILIALFVATTPQIEPTPSSDSPPAQRIKEEQQPADEHGPANQLIIKQQSETAQRPVEKENSDGNKSGLVKFADRYGNAINALSTLVMAIFTVGLFFSTHLLWKSGEKHSERELRAYVGVTDASIQASKNPEQTLIKAEMTIRNAGQTPAYDFNVIATFDFHEIPRTEFAPYDKTIKQSRSTLGPDSEVDVPLIAPKLLTAEHLKAVKDGKFAFFFYGKIKYRDAFGKDRFTDFRYRAGDDKTGSLTWEVTEEGNESS
jgi:hypothetical protein